MAGIEAPARRLTVLPPATALGAAAPVQVVLALGTLAITTPAGKLSVSGPVSVATAALELDNTIVSTEFAPALIVDGLNVLLIDGLLLATRLHTVMLLPSSVTAPLSAIARPLLLAPVVTVMLLDASIVPAKLEPVPSVAELPICQKTPQL